MDPSLASPLPSRHRGRRVLARRGGALADSSPARPRSRSLHQPATVLDRGHGIRARTGGGRSSETPDAMLATTSGRRRRACRRTASRPWCCGATAICGSAPRAGWCRVRRRHVSSSSIVRARRRLKDPDVTALFEDANGDLWIGTDSGLVFTVQRRRVRSPIGVAHAAVAPGARVLPGQGPA